MKYLKISFNDQMKPFKLTEKFRTYLSLIQEA